MFCKNRALFCGMNRSQWIALASASVLAVACFMPWAIIAQVHLTLSGVDTTGTHFGKPAYLHFILTGVVLLGSFVSKNWVKRANVFIAGINLAWAIRNFMLLGSCEAGECPQRQIGLYLVLFASIALLISAFFPKLKIPVENTEDSGPAEDLLKE